VSSVTDMQDPRGAADADGRTDEPRRAIVLGSGGVLGFAWMVGALAALEAEAGLDARSTDLLVGTSAGSVAAALLSCGVSVDEIRRHHQGVPAPTDPPIAFDHDLGTGRALPLRPRLRPGSPLLLLDALRHPRKTRPIVALAGALPTGRGTLEPVRRLVAGLSDSNGQWPQRPRTWIVATDYRTGRRVVFGRDAEAALSDAVVASCAIPAWYPPAVIDGRPYIDGGAVSNASADLVADAGVDEAYVFAPMASIERDRPRSPVSRIERAIRRAITRGIVADIESVRAGGARVMLVTPGPEDLAVIGANLMNPRRRTQVLETAMRTAAVQVRVQLAARPRVARRGTRRSPA
jgi:NTE family protein